MKRKKILNLLASILSLFLFASCDFKSNKEPITYILTEENDGYIVSGINPRIFLFENNCSIEIPNTYKNLPVIGIGK